jgi:hypothetical protein
MSREEQRAAGEQAFPGEMANRYYYGMTLRDWFAGQALSALIGSEKPGSGYFKLPSEVANAAYDMADAMLAERKKRVS